MLTTVKGTYKDGQIQLAEDPGVTGEAAVVVTFLTAVTDKNTKSSNRIMTPGMLAVPGRRISTLEDFKTAEYDDSRWDRD